MFWVASTSLMALCRARLGLQDALPCLHLQVTIATAGYTLLAIVLV